MTRCWILWETWNIVIIAATHILWWQEYVTRDTVYDRRTDRGTKEKILERLYKIAKYLLWDSFTVTSNWGDWWRDLDHIGPWTTNLYIAVIFFKVLLLFNWILDLQDFIQSIRQTVQACCWALLFFQTFSDCQKKNKVRILINEVMFPWVICKLHFISFCYLCFIRYWTYRRILEPYQSDYTKHIILSVWEPRNLVHTQSQRKKIFVRVPNIPKILENGYSFSYFYGTENLSHFYIKDL